MARTDEDTMTTGAMASMKNNGPLPETVTSNRHVNARSDMNTTRIPRFPTLSLTFLRTIMPITPMIMTAARYSEYSVRDTPNPSW